MIFRFLLRVVLLALSIVTGAAGQATSIYSDDGKRVVVHVANDLDEGRQVTSGSPEPAQHHRGLLSSANPCLDPTSTGYSCELDEYGRLPLDWCDLTDDDVADITRCLDNVGRENIVHLDLYDNALTTLPAGLFEGLTALTSLRLEGNPLVECPMVGKDVELDVDDGVCDDDDSYDDDSYDDDYSLDSPPEAGDSSSAIDGTGGLLSVGALLGIVVGGSVLLCLMAVAFCKRLKKGTAAESPSSDKTSEVPIEVLGAPKHAAGGGDGTVPEPDFKDDELSPVDSGAGTVARDASTGANETQELVTESAVWLPTTVVKQDRQMANMVWTSMITAFITYVAYSIYEMHHFRQSPGVNIEFSTEPYGLPDVALCVEDGRGCVGDPSVCMDTATSYVHWLSFSGLEYDSEAVTGTRDWEYSNPNCRLAPLSWLALPSETETSINENGLSSVEATIRVAWFDNPLNASTGSGGAVEVVSVYFLDLEVEGSEHYAGEVPYTSTLLTELEEITFTETTMALTSTEFNYLKGNAPKEHVRKYQQTSTSYSRPEVWTEGSSDISMAVAHIRLAIKDFSFMKVTEVDPVNYAAVIGAAGGAWQILCIVFGLLFVLDHKVPPQKVRRRRKKTKKHNATGPSSARGQLASASGPTTLQAVR